MVEKQPKNAGSPTEPTPSFELSSELREVFEHTGPGCVAAETNIGVVHVCHTRDAIIEGFAHKPLAYQWQLALMPTAPLLRLELIIFDQPANPYRFESFLNPDQDDDARLVDELSGQEKLYLAFHGQDFTHRSTKVIGHSPLQREHLQRLAEQATEYSNSIPDQQRDFDQAKAEYQWHFPGMTDIPGRDWS